MVGYSWSADGLHWDPKCTQLVDVTHGIVGGWNRGTNATRTPQGAVELGNGEGLILGYSGYDHRLTPHPHQKWMKHPYMADQFHESMGLVKLAWGRASRQHHDDRNDQNELKGS